MPRHPKRAAAPAPKRSYQKTKLVDVVFVSKHRTSAQSAVKDVQHQIVEQIEAASGQVKRQWRRTFRRLLPVGIASLVLVAGLAIFALTLVTNKQVVEQVAAESRSADESGDAEEDETAPPSEEEVTPAAVNSYRVDPGRPQLIEIEKLGKRSRIKPMGLLRSGALNTPYNIYDTGWYDKSSKPGEGGAMLIVGHANGPTQPGVFYNLKKLEAGDIVKVTRGDGQQFSYKVVSKEQVKTDKVDMTKALLPVTKGKGGLTLMTCAGKVKGNTFEDRMIVYAEQI